MTYAVAIASIAALLATAAITELARLPPRGRGARLPRPAASRWAAQPGEPHAALLDAAGRADVPDASALARRRRGSAAIAAAWAAMVTLPIGGPLVAAPCAAGGAAVGGLLPLLLLRGAARRRAARLRNESPELLDLIAVAVGCGLPLPGVCDAARRWADGELASGLARCGDELTAGAAAEAVLRRFAAEYPIAEVESATAILLRSRQHGTPAAPAMRALAESAREARTRRALERAARAAPRVQLVAALLLVPAALLMLAAAMVARAA